MAIAGERSALNTNESIRKEGRRQGLDGWVRMELVEGENSAEHSDLRFRLV